MASQTSVFLHTWTAASYETAAAIEKVHAALDAGLDARGPWDLLVESAKAVIAMYDNDDQRLQPGELASVGRLLLVTAESFRRLIESLGIPPDDPRTLAYDEFADRAELVALSATDLNPEPIDDPPFTLDDFKAEIPMVS